MPEFKVYRDEAKFKNGVQCWTFSVDGQASGYWCHECTVSGLAPSYYINRVISRLKDGLSREAFGGIGMVSTPEGVVAHTSKGRGEVYQEQGKPEVQMIPMKGGKVSKVREIPKPWRYTLDGKESEQTFPTEKTARAACAISAFMTRGKLGRIDEILAHHKEVNGQTGELYYDGKSMILHSDCGTKYAVGCKVGTPIVLKTITEDK